MSADPVCSYLGGSSGCCSSTIAGNATCLYDSLAAVFDRLVMDTTYVTSKGGPGSTTTRDGDCTEGTAIDGDACCVTECCCVEPPNTKVVDTVMLNLKMTLVDWKSTEVEKTTICNKAILSSAIDEVGKS